VNGSERIKARCASDSNVEVIESKLSHRSAVRSSAWLDVGLRGSISGVEGRSHKKVMLSSDDLSGSTVDPRRMMNAAITNPTKHATTAHQWPSTMLAHIPIKKMSRTDRRQQSDHNARHAGNQPLCCCSESICDDAAI